MPVTVRYYTDPACPWSWAFEPNLRRLMWEFGEGLEFVWVMGGLAREYGSRYRDEEGAIGSGPHCFADLMAHWLDVGAKSGMPIDPRLWSRNPIISTYPACQAVLAAAEQGSDAGGRYLRRVREGLMLECRKLDHMDALVGEAGPAGLDVERFSIDLASNAIVEAFAADLEEVRDPPPEAREAGQVRRSEGHERVSFPSLVFAGEDERRDGVWGWQPYEDYRDAAVAAGAEPVNEGAPGPIEVVERFGRVTTREVEVIADRPRPLIEAELWTAARDWRLRPLPAGGGTIWETA